uniref:UAS domain-containing protein n=1 Tax=Rhizophora mucronata TaxID=61149 RepID=A0A2P2QP94_RHIMU
MSLTRGSARPTREASCNGVVHRMVSLPRSIIGGLSRVMGQGRVHIGFGGRRNQTIPSSFQLQPPQDPLIAPEKWAFLATFEQKYGSIHPFFYVCSSIEALKIAENEKKFMFMYLHSPDHPFTPSFCRETLSSELVVQFLDANFVCWGTLADGAEGLQMVATLQPATFPCCAVVAPADGNSIAVLQQMEGPITPAELVETLQRTMEEQGLAFGNIREKDYEKMREKAKKEQKIKADRQLREEQDAAYLAALTIDMEKEKLKSVPPEQRIQKPVDASQGNLRHSAIPNQQVKAREASTIRGTYYKEKVSLSKEPQITQVLFCNHAVL